MFHGRPSAHAAAKLVARAGDPETSLARAVAGVLETMGMPEREGHTPVGAAA
jgi:hypothetical protein